MRLLREHPEDSTDPERKSTIRIRRIAAAIGGALTAVSTIMVNQTEAYSDERVYSNGGVVVGASILGLVITAELQERYRSGGNWGRGKRWEPYEPQEPDDPGGLGTDLMTDWDGELLNLLEQESLTV